MSHFDTVTLFYIYMCSSQEGGKEMVTMKQVRKTAVVVITGGARRRSKVKKKLLSKIWGMEGREWEPEKTRGGTVVWEAHHSLLIKQKGMWCFCVKAAVGHFSFKALNLTQSCTNFKSTRRLHCFQIELAFTKPALLFFCNLHLSNVKLSHQKRGCTPWR